MAKKKKLVDNFQEIIDSGDFELFKSVFDKCEITATSRGKSTCNAFSYRNFSIGVCCYIAVYTNSYR